jgi:folate-binding protein YgfZ
MTVTDPSALAARMPLGERHLAQGATPCTCFGVEAVAHFGDPAEEASRALTAAAIPLPRLAVVEAGGTDCLEYLNRRLAQKVDALAPGEVLRAALLGGDGRMLADTEMAREDTSTVMAATPASGGGPELAARLGRFVFSEDAAFRDISASVAAFALVGTGADGLAAALGLAPEAGRLASREGIRAWRSHLAAGGILVLAPEARAEETWDRLSAEAQRLGGGIAGLHALDALRIAGGHAWWGVETDEATIPLEAGLYGAVHFDKGCYPGQEVLARINNLGHPARQLIAVRWNSPQPAPVGESLHLQDGTAFGRITSSARHAVHGAVSLAMVPWAHRAPGVAVRAGEASGITASLPLAH